MFPSLKTCLAAAVVACTAVAQAATVSYDFDVGWVVANPDGVFERQTIGVNGQWPIPPITANVGDRVVVNVKNSLQNQTTSLHFHGIYQNGTANMDGATGVSQCPIPPGATFTYDFTVNLSNWVYESRLIVYRLTNLALIGIIPMRAANTPMVCVVR